MKLRSILFAIVLYVVSFVSFLLLFDKSCSPYKSDVNNILQKGSHEDVNVLHWETSKHWAGWGDNPSYGWAGYEVQKDPCPVKCHFHGNQTDWHNADVVLFEPQPFGRRGEPWPPGKICGQKYTMFSYETSKYFPIQESYKYSRNMDWIMTYDKHADIQVSLTCSWGLPISAYLQPVPIKEKTRFAVFVASNCGWGGAHKRTEYVKELMQYIPVDSYGLCLQNMPQDSFNRNTDPSRFETKMALFRQYKFVLAFENNNITDYVTEKLSHAMLGLSLPVYMGAPNVDEWVPSPTSIVRTDKFASPKALAEYLLLLNSSDELYTQHFAWKNQPLPGDFLRSLDNCVFQAECRTCLQVVQERIKFQYKKEHTFSPWLIESNFVFHVWALVLVLLCWGLYTLWGRCKFKGTAKNKNISLYSLITPLNNFFNSASITGSGCYNIIFMIIPDHSGWVFISKLVQK